MHPTAADGGLRGHVPARPECITPHIRFLFIAPQLWIGLPSDPASRRRPCPSPCLRLCNTWPSDFHRRSNAPCPAHTSEFTGAARLYRAASGGMMGWAAVAVCPRRTDGSRNLPPIRRAIYGQVVHGCPCASLPHVRSIRVFNVVMHTVVNTLCDPCRLVGQRGELGGIVGARLKVTSCAR